MPPITRNKSRAVRRKVAGIVDEPAQKGEIKKVERTPLWSVYDNVVLADVVGFTDTSGRTLGATTEVEHCRLRTLG
jgi:hypothetical protein